MTARPRDFDCTLTATPSTVDSHFRLTGEAVVTNSNSVEVSGVTVTVAVPGGTCVVVDGAGLTISAGGPSRLSSAWAPPAGRTAPR